MIVLLKCNQFMIGWLTKDAKNLFVVKFSSNEMQVHWHLLCTQKQNKTSAFFIRSHTFSLSFSSSFLCHPRLFLSSLPSSPFLIFFAFSLPSSQRLPTLSANHFIEMKSSPLLSFLLAQCSLSFPFFQISSQIHHRWINNLTIIAIFLSSIPSP